MAPEKLANRTLMLRQLANVDTHLKEGSPASIRKSIIIPPQPNDATSSIKTLTDISHPIPENNNDIVLPSKSPINSNGGYTGGGCPFSQGRVK